MRRSRGFAVVFSVIKLDVGEIDSLCVCLFGATGLVGAEVLDLLERDPRVARIVVVTRAALPTKHHRKTENIVTEFSKIEIYKNKLKADVFICCLGTTLKQAGSRAAFRRVDYEYVIAIAKVAESLGVRKFQVVSAIGADSDSAIFYNRIKGEMENEVVKLNIEEIDMFRPSLLLGFRREKRFAENIAQIFSPAINISLVGPLKKYRPIRAVVVARVLVENIFNSTPGRFIFESNQMQSIYDQLPKLT